MSAERWQRMREVFDAAMEAEETTRPELVNALCADDPEMRDEVLRLLAAVKNPTGFLDEPAARLLTPSLRRGAVL
jgi:hypothetical protein